MPDFRFALQRMLEHESLEMVKRYLSLAQMDLEQAHCDASPVANRLLQAGPGGADEAVARLARYASSDATLR